MGFHDTAELKVSSETINNLLIGECIKSKERLVDGSKRLRWAFHLVKKVDTLFRTDLWVSSTDFVLKASGKAEVGAARPDNDAFNVKFDQSISVQTIVDGYFIDRLGVNGFVKVDVTFTGYEEELKRNQKLRLPVFSINDFIKNSNHNSSDARIVVGNDTLEVHRHILCLISPVFHAEFTHDTKEAKTGTVNIKDFDFATVKNVIDTCYGRECTANCLADYINMLRFADKYDIRLMIDTIEPLVDDDLTLDSFCAIANYAWDLDKTDLKSKCAKFYRDNVAQITFRPEFVNIKPNIMVDIVRLGASFDNS